MLPNNVKGQLGTSKHINVNHPIKKGTLREMRPFKNPIELKRIEIAKQNDLKTKQSKYLVGYKAKTNLPIARIFPKVKSSANLMGITNTIID